MSGTITCDNFVFRNTGNFDISSQDVLPRVGARGTWRTHPGKPSGITLSGTGVWLLTGYWASGSFPDVDMQFCVSTVDISGITGSRQSAIPLPRSYLYYLSMGYDSGWTYDAIEISYTINKLVNAPVTYWVSVGGYPNGAAYRLTLTKIA
jgi:hypothetical protein